MERRNFLKLVGLATVAAAAGMPFGAAAAGAATKSVSAGGFLYRTDGAGQIYVSATNGKSWTLHSDLGSMYSTKLATDSSGHLLATVGYLGRSFGLVLAPNLRSWMTT